MTVTYLPQVRRTELIGPWREQGFPIWHIIFSMDLTKRRNKFIIYLFKLQMGFYPVAVVLQ
jgi:hypothetical protein